MGKHCCTESNSSHNHRHEREDVNLKKEVISVIVVSVLFIFGFGFENQLHNTIYSFGEYLVFIPAYLLAGWNVLMSAGKNIVKGKFLMKTF